MLLRVDAWPEIFCVRGFRFFFFSREGQEPRYIHVFIVAWDEHFDQ